MNPSSSSSRRNSNPDSGSGQQQYKPLAMVVSEVMPQTAEIESWTSQKTAKKRPNSSPLPSSSILMEEKGTCLTVVAAWTSMALAVLSGASIGPMFKYMHGNGIPIILAAAWRCQCMIIFLIPLGIAESVIIPEGNVQWFARKPGLPYQVYVHIIFASIYWAANLICWIEGLKFVSTVTASLLASTHPLMLVIYLRFVGQPVSAIEVVGVLVALVGIVVTSSTGYFRADVTDDSLEHGKYEVHPTIPEEIFGCILCLLAAAAEVGVIINRAVTKKYVPLMQYSAATSIGVTICVSIMSIALEGSSVVGICNTCVFGWVSKAWVGAVLTFGLVVGVVCICGFNYATQYINPIVFSCVQLLDPSVTGAISWFAGLEGIPDYVTWVGGFVVMSGVGVIMVGQSKREREEGNLHGDSNCDGVLEAELELSESENSITHNPLYVIDGDEVDDDDDDEHGDLECASSHPLNFHNDESVTQ